MRQAILTVFDNVSIFLEIFEHAQNAVWLLRVGARQPYTPIIIDINLLSHQVTPNISSTTKH
jgi:hypothetical protein